MGVIDFIVYKILKKPILYENVSLSEGGFNDPYADEIAWSGVSKSNSKLQWRKLIEISSRRIAYRYTGESIIRGLWWLPLILYFIYLSWENQMMNTMGRFNMISVILFIIGLLVLIMYWGLKPKVFDKDFGYFWFSYKKPKLRLLNPSNVHVKLNEIYAIQLIPVYNDPPKGGGWSFYTFEMNLILLDKRRMNVIAHQDLTQLRKDANKLSEFLDIPVWDAIYVGK